MISGNDASVFLPLSKGVPQGSILGPVSFTIYSHNITSSITNCKARLYVFANTEHSANEIPQVCDTLQDALLNLKLVRNANKTKYLLLSAARDIVDNGLHITTLNEHSTERGSDYKYLCTRLDRKVTFKFHIDTLVMRL